MNLLDKTMAALGMVSSLGLAFMFGLNGWVEKNDVMLTGAVGWLVAFIFQVSYYHRVYTE